jgi:hypothetical protein
MTVARTYMQGVVPKLEALTEEMRVDFEPKDAQAPAKEAPAAEQAAPAEKKK